ncbi:cystathionine beta-lyase [Chloropicon primus]|uniref:cysteine-S-conjugate beta-lyase n=2 Tax=Chloropicon primus TaxID=1764295 RepID=A0A5B8MXE4_9CHLO|nr:cystathionine beta-lyase [Chloropicon primus]UPR04228.1 cystathionine beta-lyase [Chloropicon primus]|eukprot:QDZ25021.1 cystathionine beta-lyase [Chloropicon primus]
MMMMKKKKNGRTTASASKRPTIETRLVHLAGKLEDPFDSVAPPLYQTATFNQPGATDFGAYDYSRSGNPTRTLLENQMADIENADGAFAFASGMAAIATVMRLVKPGECVLAGNDIYGGTQRFLGKIAPAKQGLTVKHVDMTQVEEVKAALEEGTKGNGQPPVKLVLIESPTNPRLEVCDISAICKVAKEYGAVVCVDNSIMAPIFQRPIDLGADISMTSATKFIAGHSDVTGGILSVVGKELCEEIYFHQNAEGNMMSPFECWLSLRGLKTMALRMEKQAQNAEKIAIFLAGHPLVKKVNYAGLPGHPNSGIHASQASSGGSIISFETGSVEASRRIVEDTKLFKITVSFGSVTSLISMPCYMSHASVPAEIRKERGLVDDLVRISAGIENIDDLIGDLKEAFAGAEAAVGASSGQAK